MCRSSLCGLPLRYIQNLALHLWPRRPFHRPFWPPTPNSTLLPTSQTSAKRIQQKTRILSFHTLQQWYSKTRQCINKESCSGHQKTACPPFVYYGIERILCICDTTSAEIYYYTSFSRLHTTNQQKSEYTCIEKSLLRNPDQVYLDIDREYFFFEGQKFRSFKVFINI